MNEIKPDQEIRGRPFPMDGEWDARNTRFLSTSNSCTTSFLRSPIGDNLPSRKQYPENVLVRFHMPRLIKNRNYSTRLSLLFIGIFNS
jgi:hypothetical protein